MGTREGRVRVCGGGGALWGIARKRRLVSVARRWLVPFASCVLGERILEQRHEGLRPYAEGAVVAGGGSHGPQSPRRHAELLAEHRKPLERVQKVAKRETRRTPARLACLAAYGGKEPQRARQEHPQRELPCRGGGRQV